MSEKKTPRASPTRPKKAPKVRPADPGSISGGFPLGQTGRTHPPIGLGLWSLGRWSHEDEQRTRTTADHAIARGVPWFDTAEVYGTGRSERLLGDCLARAGPAGAGAFVVTKLSWEHLRRSQVRASLLGSLQRLGRASVDLYLVHAPDPHVPVGETMGAMEQLWVDGKTKAIGVSNFSLGDLEAARSALTHTQIVVNQVRFNLFDREEAEPIEEYCRQHGIVLEAYTPLARGLLAGRYLDGGTVPAEVRRFAHRVFEDDQFPGIKARGRAIRDLARKEDVPMASIALHWLERHGAAPVFGASRPEQVDDILAAWAIQPPADVLDRADELARSPP
ncbi:MAG: aldo/keto reductase [Thermoplasmata archaeon]|nr:aldo/keto reductase [Thermoplasmata archaeon]